MRKQTRNDGAHGGDGHDKPPRHRATDAAARRPHHLTSASSTSNTSVLLAGMPGCFWLP